MKPTDRTKSLATDIRLPRNRRLKSIDDYISAHPRPIQKLLTQVRTTVRKAAPTAEEVISYNMPAFRLGVNLVYFMAHRYHIGFYPSSSAIEAFKEELASYKWAKGSVQFPYDCPIPVRLITRMTKFRVKENALKLSVKKRKK